MRRPATCALLLCLAAAACGDRMGGGRADAGGTVIIAVPGNFALMLPPFVNNAFAANVTAQVYDRLAQIGPNLSSFGDVGFQPRLAERWTWAPDSMSIAFAIDPDARWHDGRPVRASDVRFSFDVARDPRSGSAVANLLGNVDSVTVRDSLTAVVWFARRTPEQFYDFVYQVYILPEHVLRDIPRDELARQDASRLLIGSGRFRYAGLEPGARFELVADTANYRGRPKLDRVIWTVTPDPGTAIAQLLGGQADVFEFIPPDLVPRLDSGSPARAVAFPGLAFTYMGLNQRDPARQGAPHPVFGDRQVRRAISMALDRPAMLRNVFDTLGVLGIGPFARTIGDATLSLPPFDRAAAAALLDSAGWRTGRDGMRARNGRPLAFTLIYPTSSRPRQRYAVLIQEQLKNVGVRVDVSGLEFPAYLARQNARNFDAALVSISTDPNLGGARQYWGTSGITAGGQNFVSYSNPRFDALLDSAINSFDFARRRDLSHRAFQTLVDDAPAVWLYDVLSMNGMHRRIRPVDLRADGWWAGLAEWTIPDAERIDRDRIGLRAAQP
jgi:peptide/nickel transport system substrate-binding protein